MEIPLKNIVVSQSEKIQLESIGGPKYSSVDLFESESEQVPTTMDETEVYAVWQTLRDRVEKRLQTRKQALIDSLDPKNQAPF